MEKQITEVRLLSVPLENDYKHTLYFKNETEQATYFYSRRVFENNNFSYQRKEGYIRYPKCIDDLAGCNYIMYKNSDTSNKWYYAFITEMVYKGEESTWIYFELDVIQTYLFNYIIRPSFIEREHTNDDTTGLNTYPENLEVGEYVCEHYDQVTELVDCDYVIGITDTIIGNKEKRSVSGGKYNGIFSGIMYMGFNNDEIEELTTFIEEYANNGFSDSIISIFLFPHQFLSYTPDGDTITKVIMTGESVKTKLKTFTPYTQYSSYKPKNKKLYCFPYQYLLVSNNNGASAVYHFENFEEVNPVFNIKACLTPGGSIRLTPKNYKGVGENHEEGLNLGKFPICNWASDEYTNWLTQNSVNIGLNIASGAAQIATGFFTGGATFATGASTIANQLAQVHQMSFTPTQSRGNLNCGDVITAGGANTFHFYQMRIKDEYLEIIDNYFTMFGYKRNKVKVPHENHRENFWYIKTIDVNIDSYSEGETIPNEIKRNLVPGISISNKDIQKIKECYNNGITFWRNSSKIGDYSLTNETV